MRQYSSIELLDNQTRRLQFQERQIDTIGHPRTSSAGGVSTLDLKLTSTETHEAKSAEAPAEVS